jgi:histidinol-phosphatase (PHP family)
MMNTSNGWRVSLHGGHSGEFCDHGHGTLRQNIEAAVEFGYHTFGVAEHAPRSEARFLFPEETAQGWSVAKIRRDFDRYSHALRALADEFKDRLTVPRGFEAEMVPRARYVDDMLRLREKYKFDYIVASVHWVGDIIIDYNEYEYRRAVNASGGAEALNVRYYEALAEMVQALRPEVVGHLDVIRKYAAPGDPFDTPPIREAVGHALRVIKSSGAILDINTAPYRKGKSEPFPGEWIIDTVRELELDVCFGDDSHGPSDVGAGLEQARAYLLQHGFRAVTYLARDGQGWSKQSQPLE